jgi:hypothetical protein
MILRHKGGQRISPTALDHRLLHSDKHNLCRISRVKINLRFQSFRLRIFSSKFLQNGRIFLSKFQFCTEGFSFADKFPGTYLTYAA